MRVYLDTSVVVAAITREPHTGRAQAVLARRGVDLVISDWTITEVSAACAMKQRMGALAEADRVAALRIFDRLVRESLVLEHLVPGDFARAARLADRPGVAVRAGDALHLAVLGRTAAVLATFDVTMARAAAEHGLDVLELDVLEPD